MSKAGQAALLALLAAACPAAGLSGGAYAAGAAAANAGGSEAGADADAAARAAQAEQALAEVERNIQLSDARRAELKEQAEAISRDAGKLARALADAAAQARGLAQSLKAAAARVAALRQRRQQSEAELAQRRAEMAEILAGLEKLGFNPPPAMLAPAGNAAQSLHAAILMGALLPQMRQKLAETQAVADRLQNLAQKIAAEQQVLNNEQTKLKEEQLRLSLLLAEKGKLQSQTGRDLAQEEEKRRNLAAAAGSLQDLLAELGRQQPAAAGAMQIETKFSALRGRLPRPAEGRRAVRFGQMIGGKPAEGESYVTPYGAPVLAPAEGVVRYAGEFRSYGQVLILDVGENYYIVLAGLAKLYAGSGQFLLQGEPAGVMAKALPGSGESYNIADAGPRLYIELRRQGRPLDPAPWWRSGK